MANFLTNLFNRQTSAPEQRAEGEYHPGPWTLPVSGGWLPHEVGQFYNFWQMGYDVFGRDTSALVEACISAYSQTVAMCPGNHWLLNSKGGRDRQVSSALTRILRKPNDYQSISDFLLNGVRSLYLEGNMYALALRNARYEIDSLHLMNSRQCHPMVAVTGDIFYALGGNEIINRRIEQPLLVPQRDVLHVRLHTNYYNTLKGESPIMAALSDVQASGAMTAQQTAFYLNQARPSSVLSTDQILDKEQVNFLRDRWNEQSRGLNTGGTPILSAGLKPFFLSSPPKDAAVAELMKLSEQHIALAFRVPLQVLGIGGTPFASAELMMQSWIASGLGFALNHVEEAFGLLFGLKGQPDEYVEFDTAALLRSARKDRIDTLARGVQGGIFSPNEARGEESLPEVEFGNEPRVQQQVVPLSAAAAIPAAPAQPGAPPASPQPAAPLAGKDYADVVKRASRSITSAAARL